LPGDTIQLQYWEIQDRLGDAGYDVYICKGGAETVKCPYVRHTSFKLIEISGYNGIPSRSDVTGVAAYSYADRQGAFTCSDARLTAVYEMCERSARQNVQQGVISVDANREQSPWTADSWSIGMGFLYNHSGTMIADKIVKDYAGEQQPSGNFYACSPAAVYELAEWSLYWPMILWQQYFFSGNKRLLLDVRPNLESFLAYMKRYKNAATGLYNPPGWRASDYAGGVMENGGENVATNSPLYENFRIASRIARITGMAEAAAVYEADAAALKRSVNEHLLIGGERYKTKTDGEQIVPLGTAWALAFRLVPKEYEKKAVQWLASQSGNYTAGGYGGVALYSGLYEAELGKIAKEDFSRYDNMLQTNRTNWESFGAPGAEDMGNHAWTAYPAYILPRYAGGIRPTDGGFASFDIKPVFDGLDWVKTAVPTVKGNVSVSWERIKSGGLRMEVRIPANTEAGMYLPDAKHITVTESGAAVYKDGKIIASVEGVRAVQSLDAKLVFSLGSGAYSFEIVYGLV
jgi:hypothetical protein